MYVVAFPKRQGKWQISNGGGYWGSFSRDGKELFYERDSSVLVVDVKAGAAFDFSAPRKVCTLPPNVYLTDFSLDGKQFLALMNHLKQNDLSHLDVVTEWFEVVKSKFAANKN